MNKLPIELCEKIALYAHPIHPCKNEIDGMDCRRRWRRVRYTMMFEHNEEYQPDVFSKRAQVTIFKSPFSIDVSRWSAGQQQVVEHQ